jgi:hypothetical protein
MKCWCLKHPRTFVSLVRKNTTLKLRPSQVRTNNNCFTAFGHAWHHCQYMQSVSNNCEITLNHNNPFPSKNIFAPKPSFTQSAVLHRNRVLYKHHVLHKNHVLAGLVQTLFAAFPWWPAEHAEGG